jgi:hypothetical protein
MRLSILFLFAFAAFPSASCAQAPVFDIAAVESSIKFDVEASVAIKGKFELGEAITQTRTAQVSENRQLPPTHRPVASASSAL